MSQFGRVTPSTATLARVAAALRQYETDLASAGLTDEMAQGVMEWTSWCLRLIEANEAWVEASRVEGRRSMSKVESQKVRF